MRLLLHRKKTLIIIIIFLLNRKIGSNSAKKRMKTTMTFQCLELVVLCSLCDSIISFNLTKALEKYKKMRAGEMETSAPLCYCVPPPNSFALPLAQSDSCTRPPPPHGKFYCFHLLLFSGFPQRINVYSPSGLVLCSAN